MIKLDVKESISLPGYFYTKVIVNDTCVTLGNVSKGDLSDICDDLLIDINTAINMID